MFSEMTPPPKTALVHFQAGVHSYWTEEEDLPLGIAPSVAQLWNDAVKAGFFVKGD
jgi:hypothetical protein